MKGNEKNMNIKKLTKEGRREAKKKGKKTRGQERRGEEKRGEEKRDGKEGERVSFET